MIAPAVEHYAAITNADEAGELLRSIEGHGGQPATHGALRLAPHVFVRPGELRTAEWTEINLPQAVWSIPAAKTKIDVYLHAGRELVGHSFTTYAQTAQLRDNRITTNSYLNSDRTLQSENWTTIAVNSNPNHDDVNRLGWMATAARIRRGPVERCFTSALEAKATRLLPARSDVNRAVWLWGASDSEDSLLLYMRMKRAPIRRPFSASEAASNSARNRESKVACHFAVRRHDMKYKKNVTTYVTATNTDNVANGLRP